MTEDTGRVPDVLAEVTKLSGKSLGTSSMRMLAVATSRKTGAATTPPNPWDPLVVALRVHRDHNQGFSTGAKPRKLEL